MIGYNYMNKSFTKVEHDNIDENDFNRSSIENFGSQIRIVDRDDKADLDMFCYVSADSTDTQTVKKCRGLVYNGTTLVMKAFPYTPEFDCANIDEYKNLIDFDKCSFYNAHEGTLIRVFNFNGKWYTSTHKKFNALYSKWAGKQSFGKAFEEALEYQEKTNNVFQKTLPPVTEGLTILDRFYSTLNPNNQYMFLVINNFDNRIVCFPPENPTVYHVGTFIEGNLVFDIDTHIPSPTRHYFTNMDELTDYVNKCDHTLIQGVVVFAPNNKQYKIENNKYFNLYKVRGNEPSIKFRYLQVRNDKVIVDNLKSLYPHMVDSFIKYEKNIESISNRIYNAYISRFIKKEFTTVSQSQFKVVKECHSWHMQDREKNRISLKKVLEVLNIQTPTSLNHMIKEIETEHIKNQIE
jgi:hypothetical protein